MAMLTKLGWDLLCFAGVDARVAGFAREWRRPSGPGSRSLRLLGNWSGGSVWGWAALPLRIRGLREAGVAEKVLLLTLLYELFFRRGFGSDGRRGASASSTLAEREWCRLRWSRCFWSGEYPKIAVLNDIWWLGAGKSGGGPELWPEAWG